MRKRLHIKRQVAMHDGVQEPSYWEDHVYETDDDLASVATALSTLSKDSLLNNDGREYRPLKWESSCLQKKCGACAMVINGRPSLACDVRLSGSDKEIVVVEPLRKFPVIEDLLVDRSCMMESLRDLSVWFEGEAGAENGETAFEASKCLQCGLCLEICPNFNIEGKFVGMGGMAPMARLISKVGKEQMKKLSRDYTRGVYEGCGRSLACREICPAGIDMEHLLVKSNAAAVWHRNKGGLA